MGNPIHNIERDAADAARSAASSAQSNAATAQAAQSAATGAWVGAGFQAVTAFQTARAARAQEEQLLLQQAMAEQEQLHQFAMWRQTPDGAAFVRWRALAVDVAQFIRDRDATWLQGWVRAIGRAQAGIPDEEKRRFVAYPAKLKQGGLKVWAIIAFVLAGLAGLVALVEFGSALLRSTDPAVVARWQSCLDEVAAGNVLFSQDLCDQLTPRGPVTPALVVVISLTVLVLAVGIALLVIRSSRRRAARADSTVPSEAQARIERWGFDPLTVRPGYQGFTWHQSQGVDDYANRLMQLSLHGHTIFPAQSDLIQLVVPAQWDPHPRHPAEVNEVLAWFQRQDRPATEWPGAEDQLE